MERPYKNVPATQLADKLESQLGNEPLHEGIVFELLHRALESEGAFA